MKGLIDINYLEYLKPWE